MKPTELLHPEQRRSSKAYLVNELRKVVFTWREEDYPNVTDTTRRLLKFWFMEEHIINNDLSLQAIAKQSWRSQALACVYAYPKECGYLLCCSQ